MYWLRLDPPTLKPDPLSSTRQTETSPLSHSHIPVKHLLKQLEIYRSTRKNRSIRPQWLTDLIGRVSELFDPAEDVARVGFECRLTEEAWELRLFLGSTEIVGGSEDGQTRFANFRFDVLTLIDNFTQVDQIEWNAQPLPRTDEAEPNRSFLQIAGCIDEQPLRLLIFAAPPAGVGPGIRAHQNGDCEPA